MVRKLQKVHWYTNLETTVRFRSLMMTMRVHILQILLMLVPFIACCAAPDMAVLLNLTTVLVNWDIYGRTQSLNWTSNSTMCDFWSGVGCQGPEVVSLDFSISTMDVTGSSATPQGLNFQNVRSSVPIRLQGVLLSISDRNVKDQGARALQLQAARSAFLRADLDAEHPTSSSM